VAVVIDPTDAATPTTNSGNSTDQGVVGGVTRRDSLDRIDDLAGGPGDDALFGNDVTNVIDGAGGNDTVRGGAGIVKDNLAGGPGADFMDYGDRGGSITASLNNVNDDGASASTENDILSSFEILGGGPFADTLTATIGGSTLRGAGGDDSLAVDDSGGGMFGEDGNDSLNGANGNDFLSGGNGNDALNGRAGSDTVRGDDGDDNVEARDGVFDDVDCGNGGGDNALTDGGDTRVACELGGAAVIVAPTPTPTPTPTPKPAKKFKTNPFQTTYGFSPRIPKKKTTFTDFVAIKVPKGSKLVANCVVKKKKCAGKRGKTFTIKKTKKKNNKLKTFLKTYTPGNVLQVTVSKKNYKTKVVLATIRKGKVPGSSFFCVNPSTKKRTSC
jgi:Ca2+-binding RTX toxin-like protein